jgi:sterol desaturase/sphingolipid hydroxylase (fatty acid hydroxylase superfamily)
MGPVELTFLLLTPATYLAMVAVERLKPARAFPEPTGWQWIGVAFLVLSMTIGNVLPLYLPVDWIARHGVFDGTRLGVAGGAIVGFVVVELFVYAWHRAGHEFAPLWRVFHQIHHAPQRVDIPGALLFHPLESIVYVVVPLLITVGLLGLDPLAAAIVGYVFTFYGFFQHWNVNTPRWLGYVLQRPESHCVHHRRGMHYYNFADLPLWDIAFGTFKNPPKYLGEVGFEGEGHARFGAMLAFADVNAPLYGPGSRGVRPSGAAVVGSSTMKRDA